MLSIFRLILLIGTWNVSPSRRSQFWWMGLLVGFFNSKHGIWQGCPLSPYIFCMVMEFFSASISSRALNGLMPSPFVRNDIVISHLFFADDVLIFAPASILVAGKFIDCYSILSSMQAFQSIVMKVWFSSATATMTSRKPFLVCWTSI